MLIEPENSRQSRHRPQGGCRLAAKRQLRGKARQRCTAGAALIVNQQRRREAAGAARAPQLLEAAARATACRQCGSSAVMPSLPTRDQVRQCAPAHGAPQSLLGARLASNRRTRCGSARAISGKPRVRARRSARPRLRSDRRPPPRAGAREPQLHRQIEQQRAMRPELAHAPHAARRFDQLRDRPRARHPDRRAWHR